MFSVFQSEHQFAWVLPGARGDGKDDCLTELIDWNCDPFKWFRMPDLIVCLYILEHSRNKETKKDAFGIFEEAQPRDCYHRAQEWNSGGSNVPH